MRDERGVLAAGREPPRIPGVRQAGEPRIERRHLEGQARRRAARRRSSSPPSSTARSSSKRPCRRRARSRCAVLGNDEPEASVPGEVIPSQEFYDYEAKYIDDDSRTVIPARLTDAQTGEVRQLAIAAYKAIDCCGLARVDFLLAGDSGVLYLNELNTLPGFTTISMYSKMWAASGLPYPKLLDRLIAARARAPRREAAAAHEHVTDAVDERQRQKTSRRCADLLRCVLCLASCVLCLHAAPAPVAGGVDPDAPRARRASTICILDARFDEAAARAEGHLPAGAGPVCRRSRPCRCGGRSSINPESTALDARFTRARATTAIAAAERLDAARAASAARRGSISAPPTARWSTGASLRGQRVGAARDARRSRTRSNSALAPRSVARRCVLRHRAVSLLRRRRSRPTRSCCAGCCSCPAAIARAASREMLRGARARADSPRRSRLPAASGVSVVRDGGRRDAIALLESLDARYPFNPLFLERIADAQIQVARTIARRAPTRGIGCAIARARGRVFDAARVRAVAPTRRLRAIDREIF